MKNHYILIDANNLAFQSQASGMSKRSKGRRLYSGERETTAIYGVMQMVREIQVRWPQAILLMLWDTGEIWRYKIYPEYKGTRKIAPDIVAIRDALLPQREFIAPIMDAMGVPQVTAANFEADDIAAFMADVLSRGGHKVTLVTRDGDWLQCVGPRVDFFNKYDNKITNHLTFEADTGYASQDAFVEAKMMLGDASDNIPGAKGIGPVACAAILEEFGSIAAMIEQFPEWVIDMPKGHALSRPRKAIERLIECDQARKDLTVRNRVLMDLRRLHGNKTLAKAVHKTSGAVDRPRLKSLASQLAFVSVVKDMERWVAPFEKSSI